MSNLYELQLIDTNCNDCVFMRRDLETWKKWKDWEALEAKKRGINQFTKSRINYGFCEKKDENITFIPGHCMPQNGDCFKHRKEL